MQHSCGVILSHASHRRHSRIFFRALVSVQSLISHWKYLFSRVGGRWCDAVHTAVHPWLSMHVPYEPNDLRNTRTLSSDISFFFLDAKWIRNYESRVTVCSYSLCVC